MLKTRAFILFVLNAQFHQYTSNYQLQVLIYIVITHPNNCDHVV